jgi:prolyl-tRNA synthetase
LQIVDTPNVHSIAEVCAFLKVPAAQTVKTLIVRGQADDKGQYGLVALVLRGDHELNEIKAEKLAQVGAPLTFASEAEVLATIGCKLVLLAVKV